MSMRPTGTTIVSALVAMMALGAPRASEAQTRPPLEVYAGYSYLNDPTNSVVAATAGDNSLRVGWMAGTAVPLSGWLSVVAEAGGNYRTLPTIDSDVRLSVLSFMAGGRASARIGPLTEFGQVLVGAVRGRGSEFGVSVSNTGFALQPGAGLDWPFGHRLAARLELDFRTINASGDGRDRAHQIRAIAALVYLVHR
ncbi:MAG: outer membrane beta-barrel protein [Vicinamibacterales bacterium]